MVTFEVCIHRSAFVHNCLWGIPHKAQQNGWTVWYEVTPVTEEHMERVKNAIKTQQCSNVNWM